MAKKLQLISPLKGEPGDPGVYVGATEPTDPSVQVWVNPSDPEVTAITAPDTAKVGQTIVVKEVDQDGKPVKWECADLTGGSATWRKLRTFSVPADPSTDTSGITWITNDEGGVIGFEFDTDEDGAAFECSELSITTIGTCAENGAITFYDDDVRLCTTPSYQNSGSRSGWGGLQKRNGIWRFVFALGTLRFIHDTKPITTTGFSGTSISSIDTIKKLGVTGDVAFNSGYRFDIWGR